MAQLNRSQVGSASRYGAITSAGQVAPARRRVALVVRNNGAATVYLGSDASVNTLNGYPLKADEEWELDDFLGALHVAGPTIDLRYFEVY